MARKSSSSYAPVTDGQPMASGHARSPQPPRANLDGDPKYDFENYTPTESARSRPMPFDPSLLPSGNRSLANIGEQAFALGFVFAASLLSMAWLVTFEEPHPLWRLSAFGACLSLFHYLEYETTARYNLPATRSSSFLLFTNGRAYDIAYASAVIEVVVSSFVPTYRTLFGGTYTVWGGTALVAIGQLTRSAAMITAGTNFNHTPALKKEEDHQLVTKGIYGWLRHPSYFGFFWWAVGSQLLVGNKVCLLGYIVVLWTFFNHRIIAEEKKLIEFFGADYEEFKKKTPTGIPFIR